MALFIDTNVPVYAAGREHPLKAPCVRILELVTAFPSDFVTDVEVMQEIIHRYLSLREPNRAAEVTRGFGFLMLGRIEPVLVSDINEALSLLPSYAQLQSRDLLHLAVMKRLRISQVVSADTGFDRVSDIRRLGPADVEAWSGEFGLSGPTRARAP